MQYAIVHNTICNSLVALPSTEVLNDVAFDKGWRIIHQDVSFTSLQDWKDKFNLKVMEPAQFYLDYLVDEEMTEEDTLYIESLMSERCYDTPAQPDADFNWDDEDQTALIFDEFETECPHEHPEE